MRILHIIPYYKPAHVYGGPTYSASALCEQLAETGYQVTVLTTSANGDKDLDVPAGVPQHIGNVEVLYFKRVTKNNTFFSPTLVLYLYRNIKNYDVIHIHTWWNTISLLALTICSLHNIRPVLSPRGMLSDYIINTNHGLFKKVIQKLFNKRLSKVKFHCTSHAEVLEIQGLYPHADVTEIFNFVSIPKQPVVSSIDCTFEHTIRIIFLSRIDPKKGLELLFKALQEIRWGYELTIAGPYEESYILKLKELAIEYGILQKIKWVGPIYGEDKFKLLASHDLMVLTSYNENFANVVIESLAMGTAVLISNMVGLASYISEHELGWITKVDVEDIRKKLNTIYDERARLAEISMKAPEHIKRDFDSIHLVNKYIALYKRS